MANKEETTIILPGDVGHSFEEEDRVLNYKPHINYEEPPQENLNPPTPTEEATTLEDFRTRTQDIINGYKAIEQLAGIAQKRIDDRVAAGGGLDVQLDPISDAHVIDAIKRCYPEATDSTKITYEMYKACLTRTNTYAPAPQISDTDIQAAKQNPLQTDFGGISNPPGVNRSELSSPASIIKPIDLVAFQAAGAIAMFQLLLPMIMKQDEVAIAQHLLKAKHT